MANPGLLQRSLQSLNDQVKALRTGEGKSPAARLGKSVRRGAARANKGLQELRTMLGLSAGVDAFDNDPDEQRRQRRAQQLIGNDDPMFVARSPNDRRDLNATVAPEFRGQVASGLAAANSHTAGSTLADAPASRGDAYEGGDDGGQGW